MDKITSIEDRLTRIEDLLISQKTVLNFDDIASYTGLSKSYLYKLSCSGGIPIYKPRGKFIFAKRQEIDDWMLQNRKPTKNELEVQASNILLKRKGAGHE